MILIIEDMKNLRYTSRYQPLLAVTNRYSAQLVSLKDEAPLQPLPKKIGGRGDF